jgi:hypothetical protein
MFSLIWRATAIITIGYTEKRHNNIMEQYDRTMAEII